MNVVGGELWTLTDPWSANPGFTLYHSIKHCLVSLKRLLSKGCQLKRYAVSVWCVCLCVVRPIGPLLAVFVTKARVHHEALSNHSECHDHPKYVVLIQRRVVFGQPLQPSRIWSKQSISSLNLFEQFNELIIFQGLDSHFAERTSERCSKN